MVDQILFDKLIYIDRLKRAGIAADQARAHADAMEDALRQGVATKSDITTAITRLESKIEVGLRDLTIRAGGMLVVAVGVLLGFKYFG